MDIRNGRLAGARFVAANSYGGAIKPQLIILHDTAGRLDKGNSVDWFRSKECPTSAHVVVERDGTITQMVPFDRKAFHAGKSVWQGRRFCNSFAIGIEIVNPGQMDANGRTYFGKATSEPLIERTTKEHGHGWWLPYAQAQIQSVKGLCRALVAEYPDCNDITTHWFVSPGRKIDTSPLMPLDEVIAYAFGHDEPDTADVPVTPVTPADAPPATMAQSTEGNAAVVGGGLSGVQASTEVSNAMAKVAASGKPFSAGELLLQLATSPTFWMAMIALGACAYIWLRRRTRLYTHGV